MLPAAAASGEGPSRGAGEGELSKKKRGGSFVQKAGSILRSLQGSGQVQPTSATEALDESPPSPVVPGSEPEEAVTVSLNFLAEHVALVVCSYCAPHVFEAFLDNELQEDEAMAIRQMMRGVGQSMSPRSRQRFGEVIVGRAIGSGKSAQAEAGEGWAARTGGLLHGDRELLRGFVQDRPSLAEYLQLTLLNPFVTTSLQRASHRWTVMYPSPPSAPPLIRPKCRDAEWTWTPEPCFDRLLVAQGRVMIRGSSLVALRRNMERRYKTEEYSEVLAAHSRLYEDITAVLLTQIPREGTQEEGEIGRKVTLLERCAERVTNPKTEEEVLELAKEGIIRLATSDPQLNPARLAAWDLALCEQMQSVLAKIARAAGPLPPPPAVRSVSQRAFEHPRPHSRPFAMPGSRFRRLRDSLDRAQRLLNSCMEQLRSSQAGRMRVYDWPRSGAMQRAHSSIAVTHRRRHQRKARSSTPDAKARSATPR